MDDPVGAEQISKVPVINLQPLLDRIVEVADVGTLILILVIFILIGLLVSERARNNRLTKNYMSQSLEVVKVLTTVKNLMDGHQDSVQAIAATLQTIATSLQEIQIHLRLRKVPPRTKRRVRPTTPEVKGDGE